MTDEEFAAIKARWRWNLVDALPTGSQAKMDVRALCDHVERLRAFAREVVTFDDKETWIGDGRGYVIADVEALMEQARAILSLTD